MKEIEDKLRELYELLHTVPSECKGMSLENSLNRRKYLKIKAFVSDAISTLC